MAWSRLQSNGAHHSAGETSLTYTSNVTSGTKLICLVVTETTTITAVKDGAGNSMTQVALIGNNNTPASGTTSLWAMDTPAGDVGTTPTLTITGGGTFNSMVIQEVSGLAAGNTLAAMVDGTAATSSGINTGQSTVSAGAYSSTAANEYLVACFGDDSNVNNSTITGVTGSTTYTVDSNSQGANGAADASLAYGNSTNGSETATFAVSNGSSNEWATILVAFKLAAGGGAAAGVPGYPLTPPGRLSPMAYRYQAFPSAAPVLTPVSDSDAGSGADSGSAVVQATAGAPPLIPPGRLSPQAFRWHAGPTGAPVLTPVSDSDAGTGADSGYAGQPVQAYPLTPPGRSSPMAFQWQAQPSQAPVLTPVSDSDSGTGTESQAAGLPVQAYPLTPPGRQSPMAYRYQAFPSAAPVLTPASDSDSGSGTESGTVPGGVPGYVLTPPGRISPVAFRWLAPASSPGQAVAVSDSDSGTFADSGYAGQPVQSQVLTPPGRQSPAGWQWRTLPSGAALLVPVSDTDAGSGAENAYAGQPVQAYPLTPPGRSSPMAAGFHSFPSAAPVLVPVSDTDSGTGADSGSVVVQGSPVGPSAVQVPPRPFTPMSWQRSARPAPAPAATSAGTDRRAMFLVFFP